MAAAPASLVLDLGERALVRDHRRRAILVLASDRHIEVALRPGRETQRVAHRAVGAVRRRVAQADPRAAHDAVEPAIAEDEPALAVLHRKPLAAALPPHAADLEDVGVVAGEAQLQAQVDNLIPVVHHSHVLVVHALVQQLAPEEVQRPLTDAQRVALVEIGRGEVDDQQAVVLLERRVQQHRPLAVDAQFEVREIAGAVVVDAEVAGAVGMDVAVAIEHRERVAVLEHARAVARPRGRREHVPAVADLEDFLHPQATDWRTGEAARTA